MKTRGALAPTLAIAVAMAAPAWAEPPSGTIGATARAEARQQADQAKKFFEDGDYVAAAVLFDRAQKIYAKLERGPDGAVVDADAHARRRAALSNEATSYAQAGMPIESASAFASLREIFGAELGAVERQELDVAVERLSAQIGSVLVRGVPDDAEVRIDGRGAPASLGKGPIRLAAGTHSIEVLAPTFKPFLASFTVVGREQATVEVRLVASTTPARVRIETGVGSSLVTLDGRAVGAAPVEVSVAPGAHRYTVTSEAYLDKRGDFEVKPGERAVIQAGMVLRRAALGLRIEPFGVGVFPLRTDTPFGSASAGVGVHVFHDYLRVRGFRAGYALEVHDRQLNRVAMGLVTTWCGDVLTWATGQLAWCPGTLAAHVVFGGSAPPLFTSGNFDGRLTTALEVRPGTSEMRTGVARGTQGFVRLGVGAGVEEYHRSDGILLFVLTSSVELAAGVDL